MMNKKVQGPATYLSHPSTKKDQEIDQLQKRSYFVSVRSSLSSHYSVYHFVRICYSFFLIILVRFLFWLRSEVVMTPGAPKSRIFCPKMIYSVWDDMNHMIF